jgi:hypothetical protein
VEKGTSEKQTRFPSGYKKQQRSKGGYKERRIDTKSLGSSKRRPTSSLGKVEFVVQATQNLLNGIQSDGDSDHTPETI